MSDYDDLHFAEVPAINEGISQGSHSNHFVSDYRRAGEFVNPAPLDIMTEAYGIAKTYADRHGIQIRNATRGGALEVFPRDTLDSLSPRLPHAGR
jgi:hypothetical protein